MSLTNVEQMQNYIWNKVRDISLADRRGIYRLIVASGVQDSKITEKRTGIEIKFSDLSAETVESIYNFIKSRIADRQKKLKLLTEEPELNASDPNDTH